MTKLALTCKEDGNIKFLKYRTTLGAPSTIQTVGFEEATLFDDPDTVEGIIKDFDFIETPQIEVVNVSYVRPIGGQQDKYTVFLSMFAERAHPNPPPAKKIESNKAREVEDHTGSYPLYLFMQLWHNEYPNHSKLEYDLSFEKIMFDWAEFESSKYDDPDEPLYECILAFFESKQPVKVMFRRVIDNPRAGDIIAFFPELTFTGHSISITSYMHIGQHSDASKGFAVNNTLATQSGCDDHGCILQELEEQCGYENLKVVSSLKEFNYRSKCLYCDTLDTPTHYICESCGDGMCDECYDSAKEHDAHYQNPADSADGEEQYLLLEDVFGDGYGCDKCVSKALKMEKNMEAM